MVEAATELDEALALVGHTRGHLREAKGHRQKGELALAAPAPDHVRVAAHFSKGINVAQEHHALAAHSPFRQAGGDG